jgi:hypothetical protein
VDVKEVETIGEEEDITMSEIAIMVATETGKET